MFAGKYFFHAHFFALNTLYLIFIFILFTYDQRGVTNQSNTPMLDEPALTNLRVSMTSMWHGFRGSSLEK